jgi:hypothetical protein
MKITPKLVDHSHFKPKTKQILIVPTNSEPFFTWKVILNIISLCILALLSCVLYERFLFKANYIKENENNINNTLSYIQEYDLQNFKI